MKKELLVLNITYFLRETANDPPGTRNKPRPRNHPSALKTHGKMNQVESQQPQIKMQRKSWKIAWKLLATEDR